MIAADEMGRKPAGLIEITVITDPLSYPSSRKRKRPQDELEILRPKENHLQASGGGFRCPSSQVAL
jgi:hypothetical protein